MYPDSLLRILVNGSKKPFLWRSHVMTIASLIGRISTLSLPRSLFLFLLLSSVWCGSLCAQAYTSIVVFGDSLSDTGNDATVSRNLYTVNAQVPGPATGYTDGRFTDGTDTTPAARSYSGVWVEQLAAMLAAKPAVKNSLAGGTNYAYGFATTNTGTSSFTYGPGNALAFNVNNIGQQISDYLATNPVITNKTLFVVWGGANDLIAATSQADIVNAATRDVGLVQQLIAAGATDIIVPNLPPLGLVPRFNGSASTSAPVTAAAAGFDQALAAGLAALPAANPTKVLHIFQLDTYTLFNTIVGPPLASGFSNVTMSAQGNSTINPDTYLFWDDLHPTTFGHSRIAAAALTLIGPGVPTSTVVAATNANTNLNAAVQLNASVTGTSGTPVGTVTFYDGTTAIGSSLVSGSTTTAAATLTISTLKAGVHSITAQFAGVNGYGSSTSPAFTETIVAPALQESFASSSITVPHGGAGTVALTITPVGGYTGTATIACGALPAHVSCTPSPTSVTFNGGSTAQSVQIAFNADALTASLVRPGATPADVMLAWSAFPCLGLMGLAGFRRRMAGCGKAVSTLAMLLLLAAAAGVTGCGGDPNAAASGTYSIPINITANGNTTALTVTLTVQ
jgi:phospholipase/lecithinase/hemolysin